MFIHIMPEKTTSVQKFEANLKKERIWNFYLTIKVRFSLNLCLESYIFIQ